MRVYPVILCGGAGTRLWPVSRARRPKPFLPLTGETSSFQNTLARLEGLEGIAETLIVAGADHAATARRQAGPAATILAEPEGRDSAPAIAAAMAWIVERDPAGLAVILASDHHIADADAFRAALKIALAGAADGLIVTLGVAPTAASSAYGYILPGEAVGEGPLRRVGRFCEKPAPADAQALDRCGRPVEQRQFRRRRGDADRRAGTPRAPGPGRRAGRASPPRARPTASLASRPPSPRRRRSPSTTR